MKGAAAIKHYLQMRQEKPIIGLSDAVHVIHSGTEWEAEITLADLSATVKSHADMLAALKAVAYELATIHNRKLTGGEAAALEAARDAIAKAEGRS